MNKILKPIIALFKVIYNILDKLIVIPISKLIYKINKLGKKIIDFERKVRLEIADNKPTLVRDAVYRAIAIVKYSRFIELREGIDLISKIKFGKDLGLLTGIDDNLLFALLYRIQNSHLSYVIKSSDLSYEKDVSTEELKIERLRSLILQESFTALQVTA